MKNPLISKVQIHRLLHIVAWAIIIIIPQYVNHFYGGGGDSKNLYRAYLYITIYGIIFYLNYFALVPRLFLKEKLGWYFFAAITAIAVLYFALDYINVQFFADPEHEREVDEIMKKLSKNPNAPKPPFKQFQIINYIFTSILLTGFALGLGVIDRLAQNEKLRKELEKEKLHSELAFLKNQVSPHFFFNTLNNIYSLIGIDGPTAQESVLKLSKLMRYLLYESEHGETMMSHEIEFMNNYIDLMKLRISQKVELKIDFPKDFADFAIPPLLFVPFIENAFKHGVSYRDPSFIHIRMEIGKEQISFVSENSIGKSNQAEDLRYSGIGLDNVRKRLGLLFPGKHELKIEPSETIFKVELLINKERQTI
jgi:two-component system, LytTR family, sensor kinase